ncbi:unnamed protein product [Peronospora belbahrii]|nr:unnamed protein product [Peronospora belbahrii]
MDLSSRPQYEDVSQESYTMYTRYHAPKVVRPPRSSGSSTGRTKTEQVVLEFLHKVAELIIQSRVNLQTTSSDLQRGTRRARFNLDIEEIPTIRDAMMRWKEDVRLPLTIDIFWDGREARQAREASEQSKVLLERWSVTFATDGKVASNTQFSSTQDVIQQLKEVCKRISVLLRALFSFMRQLPAHRLFTQSYPSMLSYSMHPAPASDTTRAFEDQHVATSGYAFIPIVTPFGLLKVAAVYRRDCDQFMERQEQAAPSRIFQDNFIIQDYVPISPKLIPASAPASSQTCSTMTQSSMRGMDLHTDSFVPVSDADQFGGADARDLHVQRRRSSPRLIPTSITTPQQQFKSTSLVDEIEADNEVALRPQPGMSKPMAIPRVSSKGGVAIAGTRDAGIAIGYNEEKNDEKLIQHAHSYGGEHDVRLRGAAANPNVTAAPYGYGNVAIEQEQQQTFSPSLAFQQHQKQLWEGTNRQEAESGLRVSQTSFHGEPPTSNSNTSHRPLSTPPRHPKTVSLQQHDPRRRKISFNGAFVSEAAHSQCLATSAGLAVKAEAIAISSEDARTNDIAMFSASPPFQANPCELLSTSPGYSYSMNRIQSGSSNTPTFVTTDQFQLGLHMKGSTAASLISAKKHGFLPDFSDSGVTAWGVSPDAPDSFGLALVGANTNASGGRPQLSLSKSVETGGGSTAQGDEYFSDGSDLLLPFAIGDGSATVNTALDSQSTSTLNCSSRLETAAVGEFLHQLKNAPRLSTSAVSVPVTDENSDKSSAEGSQGISFQTLVFDDELASFRSLRDELAQVI